MNQICRDIFRAIHEGKWLKIEYRNKADQVTKYWIGIRDIDPRSRTMKVDGLHLGQLTIGEYDRIFIDSILSTEIIEGTYCPENKILVEDIEMHPERYKNIFDSSANLIILNYLEICNKLDTTPYITDYDLIHYIDRDRINCGMYQLTDQQFREVVAQFQYFSSREKRKSGSLKVKRLAINVLSINTNKGLYVLAYRNLNLDVKNHIFKPDEEITVCTQFSIDGKQENARKFLDADEYELLEDFEKNLEKIKDAIVNFKGGELTFDSPLNGKEYSRVTQALYCGEDDLFYAIVNVPMTENNQSVSSVTKNITDIKEQTIVKCIILLYPAEGINEQGDIDDQGYVKNLEDLKNPLATMNEDKKSTVLEMQQASEEILNKVVSDMPKEYGKKQAIDYFLDWMDKNLILDSDTMENTDKLSNMTEVFEKNYFEGCTPCVVEGKAVATGYSKVLTRLCNKAGISAHMTIGSWKYSGSYTLVNVDFEGKQVYIDASGCKKDDLWNQRYISDTLMARNMTISDLFNDEK